jgi:hypothetical protein
MFWFFVTFDEVTELGLSLETDHFYWRLSYASASLRLFVFNGCQESSALALRIGENHFVLEAMWFSKLCSRTCRPITFAVLRSAATN